MSPYYLLLYLSLSIIILYVVSDVVFILEPQTIIYGEKGTTHGSGYNYDTHVPLIFYGKGIKKGNTKIRTHITDIAPTISALLGLKNSENFTGKVLDFVIK